MKCSIMLHFIWVFTVCKSTHLGISPEYNGATNIEKKAIYFVYAHCYRNDYCLFCLFLCFTSQVNSYGHGGTVSSPNHTFSWASLNKQLTSTSCTYFRLLLTTTLLEWLSGKEENDCRNYFMINLQDIWDRARIELATPGSAVRLASVVKHVTDCATRPGIEMIKQVGTKWFMIGYEALPNFLSFFQCA